MDQSLWQNMFVLLIPVLEKILRPILVYFALVVGLRLAGKRELAQLNTFDLVVLLTLSNTVQNAIIGNDTSVTGGLIGAATLLVINYLVVRFFYGHRRLEQIIEGGAQILIRRGEVDEQALKQEAITLEEMNAAAHRQGFTSLNEIEQAVLEPDGGLTFVSKQPKSPEARHHELVRKLDQISRELTALRGEIAHHQT